jgi:hypothetical protein
MIINNRNVVLNIFAIYMITSYTGVILYMYMRYSLVLYKIVIYHMSVIYRTT